MKYESRQENSESPPHVRTGELSSRGKMVWNLEF
jgi:hypothetical protein